MQKEKIVSAVCFVHLKYGLCSRRCQRKEKCLLKSHDSINEAITAIHPATEPLFFSTEEERSRARRLWQMMNPALIARVVR